MANTYKLKVGDYYFTNNEILAIPEVNRVDIIGNELSIDEANPVVLYVKYDAQLYAPRGYSGIKSNDGKLFASNKTYTAKNFTSLPRGTKVELICNESTRAVYYLQEVSRLSANKYQITCISGIGLLDTKYHNGGMYVMSNNKKFVNLIAEMLGGTIGSVSQGLYPITGGMFNCYVEQALGNEIVVGHLPYDVTRNNLHKLMLAYGASLTKTEGGEITFCYLYDNTTPEEISASNIYDSGKIVNNAPATKVQIKEHEFLDKGTADELITVYDSSKEVTANNTLVLFDEPLHNLATTGSMTISESNCNYAIISGDGTLTGRKYVHSTRLIAKGSAATNENVISVDSVELINTLNSSNALDRIYQYYTSAKEVEVDFVLGDQRCGRQYSFTDAFGDTRKGYITKMNITPSATLKASTTFITDYIPVAHGNNYSKSALLTGSGSWEVPEGVTKIKAVLIGGGTGADGAYNGESGQAGSVSQEDRWTRYYNGANGGKGGKGSKASAGGKVLTVEINNVSGQALTYSCGAGGAGGARNGGVGSEGGATTFGLYSSANGSRLSSGVVNLFTGDIYAISGYHDGVDGVDGGSVPYSDFSSSNPYSPENGKSLTHEGETWTGGTGGDYSTFGVTGTNIAGAGGSAAYGTNGSNAVPPYGGNGASAQSFPAMTGYGSGANGSNGGSGGSAGGYRVSNTMFEGAAGGSGGLASEAQNGQPGCVIIYY